MHFHTEFSLPYTWLTGDVNSPAFVGIYPWIFQVRHKDGGFACNNSQCILAYSKCNGFNDCTDGSDETTEVCGADCEKLDGGGFACADGHCIKAEHRCNGRGGSGNCADGSDETTELCGAGCEEVEGGGFACADGKQCIKESYKCDGGDPDCADGSDEAASLCG